MADTSITPSWASRLPFPLRTHFLYCALVYAGAALCYSGGTQFIVHSDSTAVAYKQTAFGTKPTPGRIPSRQEQGTRAVVFGSVAFSPDSCLVAANERGGFLRLWYTKTAEEAAVIKPEAEGYFVDFQFSPDGHLLVYKEVSPGKSCVRFWSIDLGREQGTIEGPFERIVIAPDSRLAATNSREDKGKVNHIMLWTIGQTGNPRLIQEHSHTQAMKLLLT